MVISTIAARAATGGLLRGTRQIQITLGSSTRTLAPLDHRVGATLATATQSVVSPSSSAAAPAGWL